MADILDFIQSNWNDLKDKIKKQWDKFSDEDVTEMKGSHEKLNEGLQKKYGYKKDEAQKSIDDFVTESKKQKIKNNIRTLLSPIGW